MIRINFKQDDDAVLPYVELMFSFVFQFCSTLVEVDLLKMKMTP